VGSDRGSTDGTVFVARPIRGVVTRFDAVVFDLDDTLCTHDQPAAALYADTFAAAGVEPFGEPADLWAALEEPPPADEVAAYVADGFETVAARYDRSVDVQALGEGFVASVDDAAVSRREGVADALAAAREVGAVGLLTNGPERRQTVKLDAVGLTDAFDAAVFARDHGYWKPDPRPFEHVLDALGVPADRALNVGDSLEADVAGAQDAGLAAAWCPAGDATREPDDPEPDFVLSSLADLRAVLAE
jgi:HAD superfamily hydrolase (TIGR01509 family)